MIRFHGQGGFGAMGKGAEMSLVLHFGHRVMSRPVRRSIFSAGVSRGSSVEPGGGGVPRDSRMVWSVHRLLVLERKPKKRIFLKPLGRMCRLKRRRNSLASRVTRRILFFWGIYLAKVGLHMVLTDEWMHTQKHKMNWKIFFRFAIGRLLS